MKCTKYITKIEIFVMESHFSNGQIMPIPITLAMRISYKISIAYFKRALFWVGTSYPLF